MVTPLIIDEAAYQDIAVREGNSYIISLEFADSEGYPVSLTGYSARIFCSKKSRQTVPDILFENTDFIIVPSSGSIQWLINGNKTAGKEGSYTYNADLIWDLTGAKLTYLYGMFTVFNKNY